MPTASFTTLGCKVNQYETQRILDSFEEAGFAIAPFDQRADVVVINTCSVTSDAEAKSRYTIRRARRTSPDAVILVTGCAAQMSLIKDAPMEEADLVVPNPEKLDSLTRLLQSFPSLTPSREGIRPHPPAGRTRATLKIQDGCSVMCSYCSIPFTRPGMVSRPWREVLAEAQRFADQGYLEIVLTGVLIGAYGPESGSGGPGFEELVRILASESGVPRIRISSIEMHQVTPAILDLIEQGKVVPHLHIPLQSGDTHVLRDMNRRYGQAEFLSLCAEIRSRLPGATITTDIMVGFPTETRERFESTLQVCREAQFLKAHVFRFSPRHGTPADQWGDPVSPQEKQARARELTELTDAIGRQRMRQEIGRTHEALVERKAGRDGLMEGLTRHWMSVKFAGPASVGRTLQLVRIDEERDGTLYGELLGSSSAEVTVLPSR